MGRQLGRHARICIASFKPAEGRLQKLVFIKGHKEQSTLFLYKDILFKEIMSGGNNFYILAFLDYELQFILPPNVSFSSIYQSKNPSTVAEEDYPDLDDVETEWEGKGATIDCACQLYTGCPTKHVPLLFFEFLGFLVA